MINCYFMKRRTINDTDTSETAESAHIAETDDSEAPSESPVTILESMKKKIKITEKNEVGSASGSASTPTPTHLLPEYIQKHINNLEKYSKNNENTKLSIELLKKIPWNSYISMPVTANDDSTKILEFLQSSMKYMDAEVYGQTSAKHAIIRLLIEHIYNPKTSTVIGLYGAPGIGKTTLIKNGISKALNRPMFNISLCGVKSIETLVGSAPVWQSSSIGLLARALIETRCMNPVIFMDELDKCECPEISNLLIQLTDPSQNHLIHDRFLDINIDLSNVDIIFSYNDYSKISAILLNRIHNINMHNLTTDDKFNIAKYYVLPRLLDDFKMAFLQLSDDQIKLCNSRFEPKDTGARALIRGYRNLLSNIRLSMIFNRTENQQSTFLERQNLCVNTNIQPLKISKLPTLTKSELLLLLGT